eukprot:scaffold1404_cov166-Amphora_coffeaeformis.AAC.8
MDYSWPLEGLFGCIVCQEMDWSCPLKAMFGCIGFSHRKFATNHAQRGIPVHIEQQRGIDRRATMSLDLRPKTTRFFFLVDEKIAQMPMGDPTMVAGDKIVVGDAQSLLLQRDGVRRIEKYDCNFFSTKGLMLVSRQQSDDRRKRHHDLKPNFQESLFDLSFTSRTAQ